MAEDNYVFKCPVCELFESHANAVKLTGRMPRLICWSCAKLIEVAVRAAEAKPEEV